MKNLKLKSKLLITFLIIAIMTAVVGTIGIFSMIVLDANSQSVYDIAIKNAVDVNNMHDALSGVMVQNEKLFIMTSVGMGIAIFLALLLAILMATRLSKMIVRPIKALEHVLVKVGQQGNLNFSEAEKEYVRAFGKTKDEIGILVRSFTLMMGNLVDQVSVLEVVATGDLVKRARLASPDDTLGNAINTVVGNLRLMVMEVREATVQLGSGAAQLSAGAQSLAQSSAEQSAAVEQIRIAISDIAKRAEENAARACQAQELAEYIRNSAEGGSEQMSRMISAMDEINSASRSIATVMKAIDDIAFQTNILSLNAAVEAARAGQHGKGFAVVADEVRRLASRSADAAKDTDALITNTLEKSRQGEEIVKETSDYLNTIVTGINNSSGLVVDIAGSAMEQNTAIDEMNRGISRLTDVVYQNSATAQQSAAASDQISNQATLLIDMVDRFIVQIAEANRPAVPSSVLTSSAPVTPVASVSSSNPELRRELPDQVLDSGRGMVLKQESVFAPQVPGPESVFVPQMPGSESVFAPQVPGSEGASVSSVSAQQSENTFADSIQDGREAVGVQFQAENEALLSEFGDEAEQEAIHPGYGAVQHAPDEDADSGRQFQYAADPVTPEYEQAAIHPGYETVQYAPDEDADLGIRSQSAAGPVTPGYEQAAVHPGYESELILSDDGMRSAPTGRLYQTDLLDAAHTDFAGGTQHGLNPDRIISVETSEQTQKLQSASADALAQKQKLQSASADALAQKQQLQSSSVNSLEQTQQLQPYAANPWEDDISKY